MSKPRSGSVKRCGRRESRCGSTRANYAAVTPGIRRFAAKFVTAPFFFPSSRRIQPRGTKVLDPLNPLSHHLLGQGLYWARRYQEAIAASLEAISLDPEFAAAHQFRGLAYYALGDSAAYQYATIYAQWGGTQKALEWLDRAMRLRDPGLGYLKCDPLLDSLRREPRFQVIERVLKFPQMN